jgi:hypothetical protein
MPAIETTKCDQAEAPLTLARSLVNDAAGGCSLTRFGYHFLTLRIARCSGGSPKRASPYSFRRLISTCR